MSSVRSYERELDTLVGGVRKEEVCFSTNVFFWQVSHLLVKRFRSVHQYFLFNTKNSMF